MNKPLLSLAIIVEKSNSLGVLVNGTWNGMRGRLQRGVSKKSINYIKGIM